ncbi:MAG: hypothetical protein K2O18_02380 [Oscillospiraceae bacterium]|nr:hypothetical protein [Oscillospiraceae bacterium]
MKKRFTRTAAVLLSALLLTAPAAAAGQPASCRDVLLQIAVNQLGLREILCGNSQLPNLSFGCSGQLPNIPSVPSLPDTPTAPELPDSPQIPDSPQVSEDTLNFESEVIRLVNEIRVQNGLGSLAANEELSQVARYKSEDMAVNRYFSHDSPTYGSPFQMMQTFGITYRSAGENIAYGQQTPSAVVNAWMNSAGHRANILNSSYTQIGVGFYPNGYYWTQMFTG